MNIRQNKYLIFPASLLLALATFLSMSVVASAAPEGCYSKSIVSDRIVTSPVDCPSTQQIIINNPESNACYVRNSGSNEFSQVDCDSITVGTSDISTDGEAAQPTQPLNQTGINDPNFEDGGTFQSDEFDCTGSELNSDNCKIINYLVILINVLSGIAGMVIVGSIMFAGYTYMTARDNAGQIMKAKMRIVWAIAALVLFVFMYALLNYLVPGGVL